MRNMTDLEEQQFGEKAVVAEYRFLFGFIAIVLAVLIYGAMQGAP